MLLTCLDWSLVRKHFLFESSSFLSLHTPAHLHLSCLPLHAYVLLLATLFLCYRVDVMYFLFCFTVFNHHHQERKKNIEIISFSFNLSQSFHFSPFFSSLPTPRCVGGPQLTAVSSCLEIGLSFVTIACRMLPSVQTYLAIDLSSRTVLAPVTTNKRTPDSCKC